MLIAFNKPFGVICQFSYDGVHKTLKDYIDIPKVYPAGRLDTDSEGLLLLTDNGKLQAKITQPKHHLHKTYCVQVEGVPEEQDLQKLRDGVRLKDFVCRPAIAQSIDEPLWLWDRIPPIRVRKSVPDSWIQISIDEGKNRQVRKMCANIGFPCLRLIRTQIARLNLQDLKLEVGQWCEISVNQLL